MLCTVMNEKSEQNLTELSPGSFQTFDLVQYIHAVFVGVIGIKFPIIRDGLVDGQHNA